MVPIHGGVFRAGRASRGRTRNRLSVRLVPVALRARARPTTAIGLGCVRPSCVFLRETSVLGLLRLAVRIGLIVFGLCFRCLQALTNHFHQVEVGLLEEDSLALQVIVNDLLLLADDLGAARDLLEQYLHHVHLSDR